MYFVQKRVTLERIENNLTGKQLIIPKSHPWGIQLGEVGGPETPSSLKHSTVKVKEF